MGGHVHHVHPGMPPERYHVSRGIVSRDTYRSRDATGDHVQSMLDYTENMRSLQRNYGNTGNNNRVVRALYQRLKQRVQVEHSLVSAPLVGTCVNVGVATRIFRRACVRMLITILYKGKLYNISSLLIYALCHTIRLIF